MRSDDEDLAAGGGIQLGMIPGKPGHRLLEITPGPMVPPALLCPLPEGFVLRLWGERFAVECGELDLNAFGTGPHVLAYTVRGPLPAALRGRPASYPNPSY